MRPLVVLFVLPVVIGVASEMIFRDARKATLAAAIGAMLLVCLCVTALDAGGTWGWLAALLVSPLPIAFAVAAVLACYGHLDRRDRSPRRDA